MRREQQRKDQEMKEMISCISHDIRTPLTSISGYIEMLSHAEEQDIPRYLQIISSRLNDMEEMLDSFFEYTRLQADQEALTLQRMPLYPLLCETLLSYYAQLHEQGLDPVLRCSAEDAAIMMDPDAMKRIFQNLIINTLRYGSAPFTIVIRQEKDRVHCTFSNHADPAQIDVSRIFQRFYQGDRARQRGGSGLGHGHRQRAVRADGHPYPGKAGRRTALDRHGDECSVSGSTTKGTLWSLQAAGRIAGSFFYFCQCYFRLSLNPICLITATARIAALAVTAFHTAKESTKSTVLCTTEPTPTSTNSR